MSHTLKLWKIVIEHRLRHKTTISEIWFYASTVYHGSYFLTYMSNEKNIEACKDLHMVFIDLEKTYN